jgi:15-cis-phytoene synthase
MTVDQALAECSSLTRRRSSTFFLGAAFLHGDRRRAVSAVYAACRVGDDAVDAAPNDAQARDRLDAWWRGVERAYEGRPEAASAFELALAWTLGRYDVPKDAFEELRLGLSTDLQPVAFESVDELLVYCRRVAGVVGSLVAPIAGYRGGADTLACATSLGQAMQLTNVLRDVGEDLAMGRCYLPSELMDRYGVGAETLRSGRVTPEYVDLLEEIAALARALYREGWRGIPRLHGMASVAVGIAALNYEAILQKLRQNRYDNLNRRAFLRPHERIALIPRAVAGVAFGPS